MKTSPPAHRQSRDVRTLRVSEVKCSHCLTYTRTDLTERVVVFPLDLVCLECFEALQP